MSNSTTSTLSTSSTTKSSSKKLPIWDLVNHQPISSLADLRKTPLACLKFSFNVQVPDPRDRTQKRKVTIKVPNPRALEYLLSRHHNLTPSPLTPNRQDRPFRIFGDPGLSNSYKYPTPPAYAIPLVRNRPTINPGGVSSSSKSTTTTTSPTEKYTRREPPPSPRRPVLTPLPPRHHDLERLKTRFTDFRQELWAGREPERLTCMVCRGTCYSCGHMRFPDSMFEA
jgi:hypothetical protein